MARTPIRGGEGPTNSTGRGRPPVQHRIREGEIRNPWGRRGKPKPPVDFLDQPMTIRVDGQPQTMARREALDYFLLLKAAQGDIRAIRLLDERSRQRLANTPTDAAVELSAEDKVAFDRAVRRAAARLPLEEQE